MIDILFAAIAAALAVPATYFTMAKIRRHRHRKAIEARLELIGRKSV